MEDFVNKWLLDPTVGKLVTAVIAIIIVISLVRVLQKLIIKKIKDVDTRYRFRKSISFFWLLAHCFRINYYFQ